MSGQRAYSKAINLLQTNIILGNKEGQQQYIKKLIKSLSYTVPLVGFQTSEKKRLQQCIHNVFPVTNLFHFPPPMITFNIKYFFKNSKPNSINSKSQSLFDSTGRVFNSRATVVGIWRQIDYTLLTGAQTIAN